MGAVGETAADGSKPREYVGENMEEGNTLPPKSGAGKIAVFKGFLQIRAS